MDRSMHFLLALVLFYWRLHVSEAQPTVRFELANGTGPPQILNNNSVVDILSIGDTETGGNPLVCATQFTPCCAGFSSRAGNWYYPNRTEVPIMGAGYSFYRIRRDLNSESGVLGGALLNRRFDAMGPTGTYSCILLDLNGVNQTLYIRLYTSDIIHTTTTEELITTTVAATAQTTTTVEATTETTTVATTAQTTSVGATTETTTAATTEAMTITIAITGTGEATTIATTTQDTPVEVSTTEEPIITESTTNKTNNMSHDEMQTTEGPMATSGNGSALPTLRVICDSLPRTSKNDPLLIMAIIEGIIIAILIIILTVATVAFLHWRQKRKTGLYNLYVAKNTMVERARGGSALEQRARGGTLMSGNVAYFNTEKPTVVQKGGTLMANNVAYVTQGADQWRKPEEMETSIYVDMDKEDRMLRKTFQKIDTPILRNQSKGHDQQPVQTTKTTN